MAQHPMVKAYSQAFIANGGKEFKNKFNMHECSQRITFGYATFNFMIREVNTIASYDYHLIPKGATRFDVVMVPDAVNQFISFLPCDSEYKLQYEKFISIMQDTIAKEENI